MKFSVVGGAGAYPSCYWMRDRSPVHQRATQRHRRQTTINIHKKCQRHSIVF